LKEAKNGGQAKEATALEMRIADLKKTIADLETHTRSLASQSARMAV
jgi:hypothetical protein